MNVVVGWCEVDRHRTTHPQCAAVVATEQHGIVDKCHREGRCFLMIKRVHDGTCQRIKGNVTLVGGTARRLSGKAWVAASCPYLSATLARPEPGECCTHMSPHPATMQQAEMAPQVLLYSYIYLPSKDGTLDAHLSTMGMAPWNSMVKGCNTCGQVP